MTRVVTSSQSGPHRELVAAVRRHFDETWRRPIAGHTRKAFEHVEQWLTGFDGAPVILDSCCGTGESTRILAGRYPHACVVGIDKSEDRLRRHAPGSEGNYLLVRADVNDFWRLVASAGWPVEKHFILYPNPYPKASQLGKRWHASPAFPSMVAIGGELEVRTNWDIYADEFVIALREAGIDADASVLPWHEDPLSAFERKYRAGGQCLHAVRANLLP